VTERVLLLTGWGLGLVSLLDDRGRRAYRFMGALLLLVGARWTVFGVTAILG